MDGKSLNITADKLEQLKTIVPDAFSEGKLDWERLRQTLGEAVESGDERYVLNWAGKADAFRAIQTPTTATLMPDRGESVNFDISENIFIEGENLEALKVLQKSYYGKIKMIYIDPPYNTGNDSFVYPDKFSESREEYLKRIGDKSEDGQLLRSGVFQKNSKDSGHYHSNWLSMMYPRLFLARNLLREDGVIFVSIDDNEVHNLRLLMNEIFGEENFVSDIVAINNLKGRNDKKYIATAHERLLMYIKSTEFEEHSLELPEERIQEFKYSDANGNFRLLELRKRGGADTRSQRPKMFFPLYVNQQTGQVSLTKDKEYPIEVLPKKSNGIDGAWRWGLSTVKNRLEGLIGKPLSDSNDYRIFEKDYLETDGVIRRIKPKSVFFGANYSTDGATKEFRKLFPESAFNNPKPVPFLMDITDYSLLPDEKDIVLDFFAGSASTAHAVLQLNMQDGGNRSFICVQLPEQLEETNDAFKAGYKTISQIARERIRRALESLAPPPPDIQNVQPGFKSFKLTQSNFKLWRGDGIADSGALQQQLELLADAAPADGDEEAVLFELMLKHGFMLTAPIEKRSVGKAHYYLVDGKLAVALRHLNEAILQDMLISKPQAVVCLDTLFKQDDALKANAQLQFKDAGIEFRSI